MNNEYAIACLVNERTKQILFKMIPSLDKSNFPHISLFQLKTNNITVIKKIEEFIISLDISEKFFVKNISLVENNVFLNIIDDSTLKNSSDKIAEHYLNICQDIEYLSQINLDSLTIDQHLLVKKYGIYWIKNNFQPHITLSYGVPFCNIQFSLPESITINSPNIYPIDSYGRILSNMI